MSIKLRARVVTLVTTIALSGTAAVVPLAAIADHTTAHTIEQLQAQIVALQASLAALVGGTTPAAPAGKCSFTRSLTVGAKGDDVKCLQQHLNANGYQIAASGPGSPGNETMYFGSLTRAAVAKWQAAAGVSPAAGYFGPISRAKYDSTVAAAPAPAPAPAPTPGAPTPAGTGLTVSSAAEQPVAVIIPEKSARVPFVKLVLTASADGDAAVKSIMVERKGLADDAAFDGILLIDEDGTQIGNSKTLTSEHKVKLTDGLTVKAGTSKTVWVAANMATSLDDYSGQIARLAVTAVDAGTTVVNGAFPIESNGMTLNSTLAIGSVTMSVGSLDPGAANSKNVGTKGYYLASVKASAGSAENVTFEQIRFNQAGSVAGGDLENVMVKSGDKEYPATLSSDGKYYVVKFPEGLKIAKGNNTEFSIKADLINGSARTVDMNILRKADLVVKGDVYGYYIIVGGGSAGAASAGTFSSNQEPFYNAYVATIDKGSVLLSSSSKVPSSNVAVDVSDVTIGGFLLDVKGEPLQISSFKLNFTFTGTGTSSNITGVKIYNSAGSIAAGPKDPASGVVTFTDTWTVPVGENHFLVKAKLSTTFVSNDTVRVAVDPDDNITAKGEVTGLTITPSPTSLVTANSQTVKAGALAISVSPTPFGQNVVRGVNGYKFATFVFDAVSSGEDVRVTSFKIRDTISANGVADEINNCVFFDGATAINTGSDVLSPADDTSGTTEDNTVSFTNNLIVPKGTSKNIDLKCNITSSATSNSTHSIGLNDTSAHNVVGALTSQSITESVTTNAGSQMIIKTAGSFTVVKDASSPVPAVVLGGKTDVPFVIWKYHAVDEEVKIKDVTLTFSTSTASTSDIAFGKATVWDGATKVGEAVWAGTSQFATSTLTSDFIVPKDGDKLLTIKMNLSSIDVTGSSTAGRLLAVHYDGNSSTTGNGMSSGQNLGSGSVTSFIGDVMQIMKTVPTLEKIAVPASSITVGDAKLYRFSVAADAAGPVALNKFTFNVSSSSVSATTSNFRVYGYSDDKFSVSAYAINPLNFSNVDCVGASTYENDGTSGCNNVNPGSSFASSTEVVYFFGPVANAASSSEAITVPAGGKRYFELRGDISNPGAGTGNSFQVSLLGDEARPVRRTGVNTLGQMGVANFGISGDGGVGGSNLANAFEVSIQSANNDFVWSPMSTTTTLTGATSTADWTNGYLVPGLPTTNMDANTFSN